METINDAIEIFLESENVKACELHLAKHLDTSEALHDLLRDVMNTREFPPIIEALGKRVVKRFPETKKILANIASEIVMSKIITIARERDTSSPLDALKGVDITVAYMPCFDRMKSGRMPVARYFSDEKDATTIAPDQVFRQFMSLTGVTKDQWIKAVSEKTGIQLDEPSSDTHGDKTIAREWKRTNWTPAGKALMSAEQLFDAIDTSSHGFSPLIAIGLDAYRFVKRDWSKPMTISGGIFGLHDFDNGTGDPLRFEGSRTLMARPCQFIQPELQKFGLSISHGFTTSAFKGRMKDGTGSMETAPSYSAFEIASDIVTAVRLNFGTDTKWTDIGQFNEEAVKEVATVALAEHLQIKKEIAESAIAEFDLDEAAAFLVGIHGRNNAEIALATLELDQPYQSEPKSFR
jgi:hypothetical protein